MKRIIDYRSIDFDGGVVTMNLTFLIGNGFDLNLGLKTKYSHFLEKYTADDENDDDNIKELKQSIKLYINNDKGCDINWSDVELGLGKYTKVFENSKFSEPDRMAEEVHDDMCAKLAEYLKKEEERFPKELDNDQSNKIINTATDLNLYLDSLLPNDKTIISEQLKQIKGNLNFSFLNYNYTNTLDRITDYLIKINQLGYRQGIANKISTVMHVHGTIEHGMALGVNDESQLCGTIFKSNEPERKRLFIKPLFNEDMGENTDDMAKSIIESSDVIYIYGMSLGETDRRWWECILNWMNNNKKAILIYYSKSVPQIGISPEKYRRFLRKYREDFVNHYSELSDEEKNAIKTRMFISRRNIFQRLSNIFDLQNKKG